MCDVCHKDGLFFFNDTATTEIYTLSLHDALPIFRGRRGHDALQDGTQAGRRGAWRGGHRPRWPEARLCERRRRGCADRKSTRLNSSHANISYAVFCLKKKILLSSLRLPIIVAIMH